MPDPHSSFHSFSSTTTALFVSGCWVRREPLSGSPEASASFRSVGKEVPWYTGPVFQEGQGPIVGLEGASTYTWNFGELVQLN